MKYYKLSIIILIFVIIACSEKEPHGERDNPFDPGSNNYEIPVPSGLKIENYSVYKITLSWNHIDQEWLSSDGSDGYYKIYHSTNPYTGYQYIVNKWTRDNTISITNYPYTDITYYFKVSFYYSSKRFDKTETESEKSDFVSVTFP